MSVIVVFPQAQHPSSMERDIPSPYTPVGSRTRELRIAQPEDSIDAAGGSILDRDIAHGLIHAPDVYVCVQRA